MDLWGIDADQAAAPELLELYGVSVEGPLDRRRARGAWNLGITEGLALETLALAAIRVLRTPVDTEKADNDE